MNRVYKVIFNRRLGVWQAVSELARSQRKSGGGLARGAVLLGVLATGLFGAGVAQARCYNETTLNNGQGNANPLIRPNAQVDQGANIGYYQPVSGDTVICDNDATPVPGQPGTLLNPLNPVTQVYAASGAPGSYNKIPGVRPTENVTVHLTDGFLTKERSLPFIHVSYASTVMIDAGATITVGGTSTQDLAWAVGVMHGGSRTIITNNGTIDTVARNGLGVSIGATDNITAANVNPYVINTGLVVPSAYNIVVNNGTIRTGGINASGIQSINSAFLSITNTGSITVTGNTVPNGLSGTNASATMAAGILIDNTRPFTGANPSDPAGTIINGFPAIRATEDIFKNPIDPSLYGLNPGGTSSGVILNSGTISATTGNAIEVRAGDMTIVNRGVLGSTQSAAVHFDRNAFDEGDNTLILLPESVLNGDVVSQSANNILRLQGSGIEDSQLGAGRLNVSNGSNVLTPNIVGIGFEQVTMGELSDAALPSDPLQSLDSPTLASDRWTLTGAVSISGTAADAVLVKTGTLQVGDGGTTGILRTQDDLFPDDSGRPVRGSANVQVDEDATLVFNRADTVTYAGVISGDGNFQQSGAGTLILTGENTYAGTTTIDSGRTLQIGNFGDDAYTVDPGADGRNGSYLGPGTDGVAGTVDDVYSLIGTGDDGVSIDNGDGLTGSILFSDIDNSGVLAFKRDGDPVPVGGNITGSGALHQYGPATVVLTGDNTYAGDTTIERDSTLQVGDYDAVTGLGGGSGSIAVSNIIDNGELAFNITGSTTVEGDISGEGLLSHNGPGTTTLRGENNTYAGGTIVRNGVLEVIPSGPTSVTSLGVGVVNLLGPDDVPSGNGTLRITAPGAFSFENELTGSGRLEASNEDAAFSFGTPAQVGAGFTGTAALTSNTFDLSGDNTAALTNATLEVGEGNVTTVGAGTQNIGGLDFNGGTVFFGSLQPGATQSDNFIAVSDTLNLSREGQVQVDDLENYPDELEAQWAAEHAMDALGNVVTPLLEQDDGGSLKLAGLAPGGTVSGAAGGLQLIDVDGDEISATTPNINGIFRLVNGVNTEVAQGTYNIHLTTSSVATPDDPDGLYVGYGLVEVELRGSGIGPDGEALILAPASGATGLHTDLQARVTGAGDLEIAAGPGGTVSLSNTTNDYEGATYVVSGALRLDADNVLGNTSLLSLAAQTTADVNGYTQTVGEFQGSSDSTLNLNDGALTLLRGGASQGTLTGDGVMNLDSGDFNVSGANTGFIADVNVADGASATLDDESGLGDEGVVNLTGTGALNFAGADADGAFSKSLVSAATGDGVVNVTDTADVTLAGDNSAFSGVFNIGADSALTASSAANLGDGLINNTAASSTFTVDTDTDWTLDNTMTGAGLFVKAGSGELSIEQANASMSGATRIDEGVLRLTDVDGVGDGDIEVNTAAGVSAAGLLLDFIAPSTFSNVLSGTGTTTIALTSAPTTIDADNTAYTGDWQIAGDAALASSNANSNINLGSGAVHLTGSLTVDSDGAFNFSNALDGDGVFSVSNNGEAFAFASTVGDAFTGTVQLRDNTFLLDGDNTAALANATLVVGAGNITTVGESLPPQNLLNLWLDGGRMVFSDVGPMDFGNPAPVNVAGVLDVSGGGTIQVTIPPDFLNDVIPELSALPLMQQEDNRPVSKLIDAADVTGEPAQLALVDQNDAPVSDPTITDITQPRSADPGSTIKVAEGTYDYGLSASSDGVAKDGLYVTYQLQQVELLGTGADALRLTPQAGASGFAAEFSAKITGEGDLIVDAAAAQDQTISLSRSDNDYTGSTTVRSGTLKLTADNALGHTSLLTINTDAATDLNGHMQTIGAFEGAGGSTMALNGGALDIEAGGHSSGKWTGAGVVTLLGGTLQAGVADTFSADAAISIADAAATLDLAGFNQTVGGLDNAGSIRFNSAGSGATFAPTTLKVMGDYNGIGGTLFMSTVLGGDASRTDLLDVGGDVLGNSLIQVSNAGGLGAATTNGIMLVQVGGSSAPAAFALTGSGEGRGSDADGGYIDAGAFRYRLFQGDTAGDDSQSWYLRSQSTDPDPGPDPRPGPGPVDPEYSPDVGWATALPGILAQSNLDVLDNLHRRMGDDLNVMQNDDRLWARVFGSDSVTQRQENVASPEAKGDRYGFQAGVDLFQNRNDNGKRNDVGLYAAYVKAHFNITGITNTTDAARWVGILRPETTSLGAYWTYKRSAGSGFYSDLIFQYNFFGGDGQRQDGTRTKIDGTGMLGSWEIGYGRQYSEHWSIQPQAQIVAQKSDIDDLAIANGRASYDDKLSVSGRLGLRLVGDYTSDGGRQWKPYVRANYWHGFNGQRTTAFQTQSASAPIQTQMGYDTAELGAGFTVAMTRNVNLYAEVDHVFGIGKASRELSQGIAGNAGIRVMFGRQPAPAPAVAPPPPPPPPPVAAPPPPPPPAPPPAPVRLTLSADALFGFDSAQLQSAGQEMLAGFVRDLRGMQYDVLIVEGHTDRIGADAYNQSLSERRANSVRDYLIGNGIPANNVRATGYGETRPVTTPEQCPSSLARDALLACLQPDRRVEVEASATRAP